MQIENSVAFVTGANRGLGKAFAEALLAAGAAKVYAGARDPASVTGSGPNSAKLAPVKLDVTSASDIAAAARSCSDVTLLINNAGILLSSPAMAQNAVEALRREMEVNVYGLMNVSQAFAPAIARQGGGAIVNMLSVVSWFTNPATATYCASKHAALVVSDGMRIQLRAQGIQVTAVYAGFVDTDMTAGIDLPKVTPRQIAERTMAGIRAGQDHVLADARAEEVWHMTRTDPAALDAQMQQRWDETHPR
jgi:NAD(P)-dependent dehydrogenase (short-subunit alcohol dehydrogenase family)